MIDHISVAVRDLEAAARFYEAVLATLGLARLVTRPGTIGFGKTYPEFWINHRPAMSVIDSDSGHHAGLRAKSSEAVEAFHAAALKFGATSDGAPGYDRSTAMAWDISRRLSAIRTETGSRR